jgi:hypothetical protein
MAGWAAGNAGPCGRLTGRAGGSAGTAGAGTAGAGGGGSGRFSTGCSVGRAGSSGVRITWTMNMTSSTVSRHMRKKRPSLARLVPLMPAS